MPMKKSKYIIRKYVFASSAQEAIKIDKQTLVNDVFIDDEWMRENDKNEIKTGFNTKNENRKS